MKNENVLVTFGTSKVVRKKKDYLRLSRNQIAIMDALMQDGSIKKYQGKKNTFHYSEHAGLLDFKDNGLERISISAKTERQDHDDTSILFPHIDWAEAQDYEYMFHTHPPSPNPGSRVSEGILYEFPSADDFLHFMDYYNRGMTQGSIVMTPEGMYVIMALTKKIKLKSERKFYNDAIEAIFDINEMAIKKHGKRIKRDYFYKSVVPDLKWVNEFNKFLKMYNFYVAYQPRIKIKNQWVVDTLYLPVSVVEPKRK